jgi:energy-coupling factor transport system permease protein
LVRSAPRAFHELGLVVTVAIAFVPSTLAALQSVREADRARTGGQVVRRGRIGRLTLPVLERGLEQAITLSESMDSRGFARGKVTASSHASAWCGLGSLLAITAAFVALVGRSNAIALAALALGCVLLVLAIVFAGRGAPPRYRPRPLTRRDWITAGVTLLAPITLVAASIGGDESLVWNAYADDWPTISVVPLVALLALLAPLVTAARATDSAPGFAEVGA